MLSMAAGYSQCGNFLELLSWMQTTLTSAFSRNHETTWYFTRFFIPAALPFIIYQWYTDPLRPVPGPFLARYTKLWIILVDLSENRAAVIHALHKKYGPAVRVAPDQICFASPEALKEIYSANSRYPKAPAYESFGFLSTFTTRDERKYKPMKKRIIPSFSPAATSALEPVLWRQIGNLVKCFDKRVGQPLDVLAWFRMLALSVVGESFVGDSFSGLETEKTPDLLNEIDSVFPTLWVWWMFPVLSMFLQYSPFPSIRKFIKAATEFRKYCITAYEKSLATKGTEGQNSLISRMVNERTTLQAAKLQRPIPRHLTDTGIVDELTNLIFAGTDTTGVTLTYLFWELAHNLSWQLELREELVHATGCDKEMTSPKYDALKELPVLDAVIMEVLRVYPAGPAGLQRMAPEGGAVIAGLNCPAGTIVSCQALTTQRNPVFFPDPDRFNPQRWLDAEKGAAEVMRDQLMVFGKGARACLGQRLAVMELKCCVAAMIKRYGFKIGSATTDKDMEMMDHFVLAPRGGKCVLRLTRVG